MNKYQKAYNLIDGYVLFHSMVLDNERFKELLKALSILNELAEKATPKKLKSTTIGTVEVKLCTNCGEAIQWFERYCHGCGQKLDWLERSEDEK